MFRRQQLNRGCPRIENMGKTHRHFGRENGEDAKFHRWFRNTENGWCRKDNDRIKVAELATSVVHNEKVSIKTRKTAIPRSKKIKRYGYRNHPFAIKNSEWGWYDLNPIDPEGWYEERTNLSVGCGCGHSHE